MSDWLAAEIYIGGDLYVDEVGGLEELLAGEGFESFGPDGGNEIDDKPEESYGESLIRASSLGRPWRGYSPEVKGGEFDEIEEFCRKNSLSYKRWTEARWDLGGYWEFWSPGRPTQIVNCDPQSKEELVPVSEVRSLTELVSDIAFRRAVDALLNDHTLPEIPPLRVLPRGGSE